MKSLVKTQRHRTLQIKETVQFSVFRSSDMDIRLTKLHPQVSKPTLMRIDAQYRREWGQKKHTWIQFNIAKRLT